MLISQDQAPTTKTFISPPAKKQKKEQPKVLKERKLLMMPRVTTTSEDLVITPSHASLHTRRDSL